MTNSANLNPSRLLSLVETETQKREAARTKFTEFCRYIDPEEPPARHHEILCNALDKVVDGEIRNLMVFMPPGSAKSTYTSVRFPPYYLGRFAKKKIISASYGDELATYFGRRVRNTLKTKEYQTIFPDTTLSEDSQAKGEWETQEGGGYYATGVGGSVTGRRGDLGLIDDPVRGRKDADSDTVKKATWDWYNSDFLTRLKPGAAQVIIQTRWVEDDISGRILPEDWNGESGTFEGRDGKTWLVICIQAEAEQGKNDPLGREPGEWLWPEWFTPEFWEETKKAQMKADIRNWSALYQQRPAPIEGSYFKRKWFRRYSELPEKLNIYITHDDAVTEKDDADDPDFTEIAVWGVDAFDNVYAVDWWSGQEEIDTWIPKIVSLIERYEPHVVVGEGGVIRRATEPGLKRQMRRKESYSRLEWLPSINDKEARARSFQALCSLGQVYFPHKDWAEEVIEQCIKFPGGKHDDKVDACGLIGRAINQTWAPKAPKVTKKDDPMRRPTLDEMIARHSKGKKKVTGPKRI